MTTDDLVWSISLSLHRGSTSRCGEARREEDTWLRRAGLGGHDALAEEDGEPTDRTDPDGEDGDETTLTGC